MFVIYLVDMHPSFKLACALFALIVTPLAEGKVIALSEFSAWRAALPGSEFHAVEFDGPRQDFAADSRNPLEGVTVELRGGVGDPGPTGLNGSGFLRGELDADGTDALALDFGFPASRGVALLGLQNDSFASPANLDLAEIALAVDGQQWILSDLLGAARGAVPFVGFVADTPITSLTMFHAGAISDVRRSSEAFYLDGLVRAQAVPEPAPLALLLTGLLALPAPRRAIVGAVARGFAAARRQPRRRR